MDVNLGMFWVTVVYAVTTIAIFIANLISANSAKNQLKESTRQFDESRRLDCMPFLQLETLTRTQGDSVDISIPPSIEDNLFSEESKHYFVLKNLGKGTAINLYYSWEDEKNGHNSTKCPSISAIMSGDRYQIRMISKYNENIEGWIEWHFDDMINHHYYQKVKIKIENNIIVECDNDQVYYDASY